MGCGVAVEFPGAPTSNQQSGQCQRCLGEAIPGRKDSASRIRSPGGCSTYGATLMLVSTCKVRAVGGAR